MYWFTYDRSFAQTDLFLGVRAVLPLVRESEVRARTKKGLEKNQNEQK